jgi:aspartate aminotransferase-like enzyme
MRIETKPFDRRRPAFQTKGPVVIFPSSGTGACEAAFVNTLSPGDRVLIFETGWFSHIAWRRVAEKLGLTVEYVPGTWWRGVSAADVEARPTTTPSTTSPFPDDTVRPDQETLSEGTAVPRDGRRVSAFQRISL